MVSMAGLLAAVRMPAGTCSGSEALAAVTTKYATDLPSPPAVIFLVCGGAQPTNGQVTGKRGAYDGWVVSPRR